MLFAKIANKFVTNLKSECLLAYNIHVFKMIESVDCYKYMKNVIFQAHMIKRIIIIKTRNIFLDKKWAIYKKINMLKSCTKSYK